ncbi:glucan synthase subunit [Scheffersomyces xylosifermentans]|uniref:glucan synthase subunit n=1 Tax=Scheffersomyces xylosifermentans TaxID=1304137 RepID=UPI00315C6452
MARRDLTYNEPKPEAPNENPFDSTAESSSFESRQHSTASSYSQSPGEDQVNNQYGRPFNAYYNHSGSGVTSRLLSDNSSEDPLPSNIANARPSEYDRYPSMAGSRVVSMTSLQNLNGKVPKPNKEDVDSSSLTSNPLSYDFSPFGGYPASSFPLHIDEKEPDDYLHNPDPVADAEYDKNRFIHDLKTMDRRSLGGLLGVIFLILAAGAVFIVLPVLTYSNATVHELPEHYEILTQYSYPMLSAIRTDLVDSDTPESALTTVAMDGSKWKLVFSDEFNVEGRTFYEGDDQFFTAPDLHYDATKDLEWYDPDAVTTSNGSLALRMDAFKNHNLFYRSGMVQTWNKFCFTQGKIEMSARLPNYGNVSGLWPGMWTMGNLGRPGYLATTDGVWPYSYDSCDVGITPNQSSPDGISYLPGQRLNSCTCNSGDHPNPGVGRGAPEIDVIEAEVSTDKFLVHPNLGIASQSLQIAPMDIWYYPDYDFVSIHNASVTSMNTYTGGPFQEAISGVTNLNVTWYERGDGDHLFQSYGFEYLNDNDKGYVTWFVGQEPTFTVYSNSLHPNGNIGWRRISKEPMSIVMNLGISNNWAYIDWPSIIFPCTFRIDYVRVYQPADSINVGCDPTGYPTYDYIQSHLNIYENVNLTHFTDGGYTFPKNKLVGC